VTPAAVEVTSIYVQKNSSFHQKEVKKGCNNILPFLVEISNP
jgi:hypothetical protein